MEGLSNEKFNYINASEIALRSVQFLDLLLQLLPCQICVKTCVGKLVNLQLSVSCPLEETFLDVQLLPLLGLPKKFRE